MLFASFLKKERKKEGKENEQIRLEFKHIFEFSSSNSMLKGIF